MLKRSVKQTASQNVEAGEKTSMQVLIGSNEGPHFAMRRFCIEPGGSMPCHTNTVEHEQFVLRGRAPALASATRSSKWSPTTPT